MHGLPEGKRKIFKRGDFIQQFILASIMIACVVFAFVLDIKLLKVLSVIAMCIVGVVIITYYTIELMTGAGYVIASAFNEIIYLVLGLPILVVAAGFLPASLFIAFFQPSGEFVVLTIYIVLGALEFFAILFLISRYLRDKKMNLFQYVRYLFDFERRKEDNRRIRERNEQIDGFYNGLNKVEDRIAQKLQEKATGFDEFDWKERVQQISGVQKKEVKCWNCSRMNDEDAIFCTNCSAPLKRE